MERRQKDVGSSSWPSAVLIDSFLKRIIENRVGDRHLPKFSLLSPALRWSPGALCIHKKFPPTESGCRGCAATELSTPVIQPQNHHQQNIFFKFEEMFFR
jgi:hypothetical protein